MIGKEKCNILKAIRVKIATLNGIDYKPRECTHEGPCPGTCPLCEAEAEKLMSQLFEKEANGCPINIDANTLAEFDILAGSLSRACDEPLYTTGLFEESDSEETEQEPRIPMGYYNPNSTPGKDDEFAF